MITNEKQYRITRTRLANFERALDQAERVSTVDLHPKIVKAQRDSLQSMVQELRSDLAEYESLKNADQSVIKTDTFEELGASLIKARIASGLSQKALAERLGIKEQQIQRYEADSYQSASYRRLGEVANAIGVRIENQVLVPLPANGLGGVMKKLAQIGLSDGFVFERLLPTRDRAIALGEVPDEAADSVASKLAQTVGRVYGWDMDQLVSSRPLTPPRLAAAEARFKIPKRGSARKISLEAAYANYLAVAVLEASEKLPQKRIPNDPAKARFAVEDENGSITLERALHYMWDLGIPVLPLRGEGGFHGACWRYEGRNVIVLKQNTRSEARWLFDLMHEFAHAGQHPEMETLEIIEGDETSAERRESPDEIAASRFAGAVLLKGQAEQLTASAVKEANGSVERLKSVVPRTAEAAGVSLGALANYIAFRLSLQRINWWGAATNLQKGGADPWSVARDVFYERFSFTLDSRTDRDLLEAALR
jgi:transcriptional regulator with XRE-family HTH domain/Zn-dependent peptidase ImmA (M78 family)